MKLSDALTDDAVLKELGHRLTHIRLEQNLTQAALAEKAGVGLHTLQRLEAGETAARLSVLFRLLRALNVLNRFDALFPEPTVSPIALIRLQGKQRQRASRTKKPPQASAERGWTWEK